MPIIHEIEQRDAKWYQVRIGKVTASELDNLLTPKFEARTGEMPKTYLCRKAWETYRGTALPGFTSHDTEQGEMLEDEARADFALDNEHVIRNVGFVETDDGKFGCSPDALLDEDGGLEIKCPAGTNHCRYLLDGILPPAYAAQVHGSLLATGRPWWKFYSFHRDMPPVCITVQRDEEICGYIQKAVDAFHVKLATALAKLRA